MSERSPIVVSAKLIDALETYVRKVIDERDQAHRDLEEVLKALVGVLQTVDVPGTPYHGHRVDGVWDGGGQCEDCAAWQRARALVERLGYSAERPSKFLAGRLSSGS